MGLINEVTKTIRESPARASIYGAIISAGAATSILHLPKLECLAAEVPENILATGLVVSVAGFVYNITKTWYTISKEDPYWLVR